MLNEDINDEVSILFYSYEKSKLIIKLKLFCMNIYFPNYPYQAGSYIVLTKGHQIRINKPLMFVGLTNEVLFVMYV